MYRSLFKWLSFSIVVSLLFTTCAEEIELDFPFASLSRENGLVFKDSTLCVGQNFDVKLRINAGDSRMTQLEIYENAELMPTSRFFINGKTVASNPIPLEGGEQSSATFDIMVVPLEIDTFPNAYTFRVVDELNQPAAAGVTIDIGGPKVDFLEAPNRIATNASIFAGNLLQLRMELTDCWQELKELQIYEDGVLLPSNQVDIKSAIDSSSIASNNPIPFSGEDRRQFTYDITINPSAVVTDSTEVIYSFQLINDRDQITYDTLRILSIEPTLLTENGLRGILFNQALKLDSTQTGIGGLDLDTGESVDADSSFAEIQDEGIKITLEDSLFWRQQISVVDTMSTQMRIARFLLEQTFESVEFKEQIIDIFNRSQLLAVEESFPTDQALPLSDSQQGERVSPFMKVGDVFVIRRGVNYYLIQCRGIEEDTNGNSDFYEFSIKY
ncbi:MAG: hypothetical protein AAGG68_16270 [Bacteroidota bacterium]